MTPPVDRRGFIQHSAVLGGTAALASVPATGDDTTLTAGAARRDITPENGDEFFGYVRPDIRAEGVALRLFGHALVLDDDERKVALISADLGAPQIRESVLEHVRPLGFDSDTVLFACTHTHAGPNDMDDWMAAQIGDAVAEADANREPARAAWATTEIERANQSRSVEAHLANHGQDHAPGSGSPDLDPEGPNHARDTTLRMLRVDTVDGHHVAAWTHFSNHPTAYTPHTTTYSADFSGVAQRRFADGFEDGEAPLPLYTNGNLGDLIPVYDDYNQHAVADSVGKRVAAGMRETWERAGDHLSESLPVDGVAETVTYEGQEVEDDKRVGRFPVWGAPTYGGASNGPTFFYEAGLEGKRRPEALADPVQGRKVVTSPAPWSPDVEVQALRVGDRLLLAAPGEPTTQMGRRTRAAATEVAPDGIEDVAVVGIANGYNGYFTTPEEYDQQHYEGGHTVFGKYTSLLIRQTHEALSGELAAGPSTPRRPEGSRPDGSEAPVGDDGIDGTLASQPRGPVERMEPIGIRWEGGRLGRERPVGEPFLAFERAGGDGTWRQVATDLDVGFLWWEATDDGEYAAIYDVPRDLDPGRFRLRVHGAGYDLPTDPFEVVPSSGLRLRGVRTANRGRGGGTELVFLAQNPRPDPERNLRTRPREPAGGSLQFEIDGREHRARWDADVGGWTATIGDVSTGDVVTVPEHGLVDGLGNTSGDATDLQVGEVDPVEWPPNIGPGGGRPPGPAGIGTFPP